MDDANLGSEFFLRPWTPLWPLIASSKPGGRVEETELVAGEAAAWEVSLGGGGGRGGIGGAPLGKGISRNDFFSYFIPTCACSSAGTMRFKCSAGTSVNRAGLSFTVVNVCVV